VSRPAGLPDWRQLLDELAAAAKTGTRSPDEGLEEAATRIKDALGEQYHDEMVKQLNAKQHAVGHALLAGLRVKQMVTTNFDPCMELALEPILDKQFRVLARQLANGGMAWLLKLHGDIGQPDSLILTCEDLDRHAVEGAPLRGVVQSLLLTSHLLFVGFSFKDKDFLEPAAAVSRVRAAAEGAAGTSVGTALALTQADADSVEYRDLRMITMLKGGRNEAALLDIPIERRVASLPYSVEVDSDGSAHRHRRDSVTPCVPKQVRTDPIPFALSTFAGRSVDPLARTSVVRPHFS
jgi:hypothetical protein